jgi:uncharacterized protein (DUF1778 family)
MDTESAFRKSRLNFQVSSEHKQLLERAASICGQTVSEFAISKLLPLAEETVAESERTRLTARDRDLFLNMLDSTPEPNEALRRAADRYRKHCG